MKVKPRNEETILQGMVGFLIIAGIFSFAATILMFALYYQADLEKARTMALTTAVFCEMFTVLSCRSNRPMKEIGFFSNKFLTYAVFGTILLQLIAVYTPLALLFGFKALSLYELGIIVLVSFPVLLVFETLKALKVKI